MNANSLQEYDYADEWEQDIILSRQKRAKSETIPDFIRNSFDTERDELFQLVCEFSDVVNLAQFLETLAYPCDSDDELKVLLDKVYDLTVARERVILEKLGY